MMDGNRGCAMGRIEQMIRYAIWSKRLPDGPTALSRTVPTFSPTQ